MEMDSSNPRNDLVISPAANGYILKMKGSWRVYTTDQEVLDAVKAYMVEQRGQKKPKTAR